MQEGIDPVSGNEVPLGATSEEVRDDVEANLSEGEYVIPANVVRYFGVAHFEKLIERASKGLEEMSANGRIGGEESIEADVDEMEEAVEPVEMAEGGVVPPYDPTNFTTGFSTFGTPTGGTNSKGVENKIFLGPDGSRRVIMFINGVPVTDIPPGFVEDTPDNRHMQRDEEDGVDPDIGKGTTGAEVAESQNTADWAGMSDKAAEVAAKAGQTFAGALAGLFGGPVAAKAAKDVVASEQRSEMRDQNVDEDRIDSIVSEPKGLMGKVASSVTDRNPNTSKSSPVSYDPNTGMFSKDGIEVSKSLMDAVNEAVSTGSTAGTSDYGGDDGDDGDDGVGYGGADSDAFGAFNKGGLVSKPKPAYSTKKKKTYKQGGLVTRR